MVDSESISGADSSIGVLRDASEAPSSDEFNECSFSLRAHRPKYRSRLSRCSSDTLSQGPAGNEASLAELVYSSPQARTHHFKKLAVSSIIIAE